MQVLKRLAFGRSIGRKRRRGPPEQTSERDLILASGLFDGAFYLAEAPDVGAANFDPLDHFLAHGWREGRRPNPLFDPAWYRHLYLRESEAANPLVHYISAGEAGGCRPIAYFDPNWYRRAYGLTTAPLRHYLEHRHSRKFAPNAHFDLPYYHGAHAGEIGAGHDPFAHLIEFGGHRDLDPSAGFDSAAYRKTHMRGGSRLGKTARDLRVPLVHDLDARLREPAGVPPYVVRLDTIHLPSSEIAALAALYAQGGDEARGVVGELLAVEPSLLKSFMLPLRIAIALRDTRSPALAERFLGHFAKISVLRPAILNELMQISAFDGRPGQAACCFELIRDEGVPTRDQRRLASWCYARDEQYARAFQLLRGILEDDPTARQECAASAQFYGFYRSFGKVRARHLLEQVHRMFPRKPSIAALEAEIDTALREREPYLLLRLGDGEGSYIQVSDEDELKNLDYYEANRKEFLDFWFADESLYTDVSLRAAMREFNAAITQANCIGGIYRAAVDHEYHVGSRRGIAWVINTMRAVLQRGRENPGWAERTMIFHLTVHYDLLISGALGRLIAGAGRVGLISCHAELPAKIAARFGVEVFEFHKIPGEKRHGSLLGDDATVGTHWPDRFDELCGVLDAPADRRGQLFLVAAGILGKIYASKLKQAGAVVIDAGAVADLWMGKATREFPALPREVSLEPN